MRGVIREYAQRLCTEYQQRIELADCANNLHAWVVSSTVVDEDGDVQLGRVCLACRDESSHNISKNLFMGIKVEHLWMAPEVRLGT